MKILYISLAAACVVVGSIEVIVNNAGLNDNRSDLHDVYLFPGLYSGIAEQRTSFFIAALYSIINSVTLVLPQWILDYNQIENATIKSFDYVYTIDYEKVQALDDLKNFRYTKDLPSYLLSRCLLQLHASSSDYMYFPNSTILRKNADAHGVICTHGEGTFFSIAAAVRESMNALYFLDFRWHPAVQSLRSTLILNELYYDVVDAILHRMRQKFGHSDFISVHTTVEESFFDSCRDWPKRPVLEPNELQYYRACYESDETIYYFLTNNVAFPVNNSVLMIMNKNRRDAEFQDLPNLCNRDCAGRENCYVFHCIRKESLITDAELFEQFPDLVQSSSSVAMIDSVLATHGILFLGNMYSMMSMEIMQDRQLGRTPYTESVFYNRYCHQHSPNLYDCV